MAGGQILKWTGTLVVLGGIAVGTFVYLQPDNNKEPEYVTSKVSVGDIQQTVTATGTLNPVTNVTVGSQISGIIQSLYADWNSKVKAGQILAELDPATYKANVSSAEASVASAEANLELAQSNARRDAELFQNKLIASYSYEQTVASLHQAEAQVKTSRAALERAKVDFARCTIYSPVDGIVISRNVDIGQTVAASMSAPTLFVIANDLTQMQIDANVSEADIGNIAEGQQVDFTVYAFPEQKFVGKVVQVRNSPTTVQNVVTYDTVIGVANPDLKLRPGMTADASIITAERTGAMKIPNAALRFRLPEPSTNQSFVAKLLAKIGFGKTSPPASTNGAPALQSGSTNATELAAGGDAPLTGNEPPEELARRVREMRDRGEEPSPQIREKLRELFQSGAIQFGGGGGGRGGGPGGGRGGRGGGRGNQSPGSARTIYVLAPNPSGKPTPEAVRVRTGITDGTYTEVTSGLKDGDLVITSVKLPQLQATVAPGASSPFGGGGGFRGGFRGGR